MTRYVVTYEGYTVTVEANSRDQAIARARFQMIRDFTDAIPEWFDVEEEPTEPALPPGDPRRAYVSPYRPIDTGWLGVGLDQTWLHAELDKGPIEWTPTRVYVFAEAIMPEVAERWGLEEVPLP